MRKDDDCAVGRRRWSWLVTHVYVWRRLMKPGVSDETPGERRRLMRQRRSSRIPHPTPYR